MAGPDDDHEVADALGETGAKGSVAEAHLESLLALRHEFARAPSAHNTQPWRLERDPDVAGAAVLHWDASRTLPVADPTMRDNFLTLGAYVETVLIVASGAGVAVEFEVDIDLAEQRVGRFVPADSNARYPTQFTRADIEARGCSRITYEPGQIADDVREACDAIARPAGGRVAHVSTQALIESLVDADRHMWKDAAITRELTSWLRLSRRHPHYREDGLTYEALGMKGWEAVALRGLSAKPVYAAARPIGLPSLLASFSKPLLDYDGSVLVLCGSALPEIGSDAGHAYELGMGRVLMRVWLELAKRGLSVHPLSQIIDAPSTYARLHALLGDYEDERLFAIFRVGRSAGTPVRSARRA